MSDRLGDLRVRHDANGQQSHEDASILQDEAAAAGDSMGLSEGQSQDQGEAEAGPGGSKHPQDASAPPEGPSVPEDASVPGDELLTVGQVAERAGVHENTVRKHLKANTLPFFLRDLATGEIIPGDVPQDQWPSRYQYLLSAEVVAHLASQTGDAVVPSTPKQAAEPLTTTSSAALAGEASRLRTELSEAQVELSATKEQLDDLRSERDWLRSHLHDITAFLPAATEQADTARSELQDLQDQARQLQGERDLERQARRLAAVRFNTLSWWRRARADFDALVRQELHRLREDT